MSDKSQEADAMGPDPIRFPSRHHHESTGRPTASRVAALIAMLLITAGWLVAGAASGAAGTAPPFAAATSPASITAWLPASAPLDGLQGRVDLYYDGMAGRLMGAGAEAWSELGSRGAV